MIHLFKLKHCSVSIFYTACFLILTALFRTEANMVYGYIAAWCIGLWISSIFHIKLHSIPIVFVVFLIIYFFDGILKFYLFTAPKQTEGITLIIFALANCLPIIINYTVERCMLKFKNE